MLSLYPGAAGKRTRVDRKIFADDGTLYQYKDALSSLFFYCGFRLWSRNTSRTPDYYFFRYQLVSTL